MNLIGVTGQFLNLDQIVRVEPLPDKRIRLHFSGGDAIDLNDAESEDFRQTFMAGKIHWIGRGNSGPGELAPATAMKGLRTR